MNNIKRIISMLLTVLLLLGAISGLSAVTVFAAEEEESSEDATTAEGDTTEGDTTEDGTTEDGDNTTGDQDQKIAFDGDYINYIFTTPEEKLSTMELRLTKGNYELYVDDYSGEVAIKNTVTEDIIFTNPYDVGAVGGNGNSSSEDTKEEILSQLIVEFKATNEDTPTKFYSYVDAVLRDQITVKNIKNGIRVEYTMGREQAKMLVPKRITGDRFEKMILEPLSENLSSSGLADNEQRFIFLRMSEAYYTKHDLDNCFEEERDALIKKFPTIERDRVIYEYNGETETQQAKIEEYVKTYCPDYTYEEMEYDHTMTEYVAEDENPPLFRMALEYTLDENGVTVRLPANGIRFNEALYQLQSITVLPFMGARNSSYDGYNFYPDGSGTLFELQGVTGETSFSSKIYGPDYAYHSIVEKYQQAVSYPAFGIVEDSTYYTFTEEKTDPDTGEVLSTTKTTMSGALADAIIDGRETGTASTLENYRIKTRQEVQSSGQMGTTFITLGSVIPTGAEREVTNRKHGYLAIIEEGDALAEIINYHSGNKSNYDTIKMSFNPRPSDKYNLAESISVGTNSEWTVVSERKYVGSYKIRYVMLSDGESEETETAGLYDASWFGMAVAYRNYLMDKGILSAIDPKMLTDDIPLYIETFGTLETLERIMTFPVWVMTPLTTFENIKTMYEDMVEGGVQNVNFKLTGYANGGMYETVPYKFDVEDSVGGEEGFQELLDYAANASNEENSKMGIFPNFDFAYYKYSDYFDGIDPDKHVAKTIDDRYASKRVYSATRQTYVNYYDLAISPAYYYRFYEKLTENYLDKYENVTGISVGTLGYTLNSDFDEDEPYNREDSKKFTMNAFEFFDEKYDEVMTDSGNVYVWKYVDHMLDVALDSSHYNKASAAVPFIGVVLHGSVQFAGQPLNMEGNMEYAKLKAIENGASPYFVLSYQNTQNLKDDYILSEYYSVRYDIWKDDLIEAYNELNDVLGDVQDKYIIGHDFIDGLRIPDSDELMADVLAEMEKYFDEEVNAAEIARKEQLYKVGTARISLKNLRKNAQNVLVTFTNVINAEVKVGQKMVEDYFKDCAALDELIAKGYDKLADSEDEEDMQHYQEYLNASKKVTQGITGTRIEIAKFGGRYPNTLESTTKALAEQIAVAYEYVEIIAAAENDVIEYEEGKEGDVTCITNYDELTPITKEAVDCMREAVDAYNNTDVEGYTMQNAYTLIAQIFEDYVERATADGRMTEKEIKDLVVKPVEDDEDVSNDTEDKEIPKYFTENIVVVTYGSLDGVAYKYVILNYNNYSVSVTYNDIQYTVPAYGFVPVTVKN